MKIDTAGVAAEFTGLMVADLMLPEPHCELARRLGLEGFEFRSAEEIANKLLSPHDFPRTNLREASYDEISPGWLRARGFQTPSQKIELYCEGLIEYGYEPLPVYVEPSESPASQPELAAEYPLVLTTGHRLPWFANSQMHEIPSLARHATEPPLEIHAETAGGLGISNGDGVLVETKRGRVEAVARYADISPGVVSIPHGFPGAGNANLLTDDEQLDPLCATPAFRSLLCRVSLK